MNKFNLQLAGRSHVWRVFLLRWNNAISSFYGINPISDGYRNTFKTFAI